MALFLVKLANNLVALLNFFFLLIFFLNDYYHCYIFFMIFSTLFSKTVALPNLIFKITIYLYLNMFEFAIDLRFF